MKGLRKFIDYKFLSAQANVTISKSRSGPVYAGTEFVLTADISLSGVNRYISLNITWSRGNDVIASDTRTTVSSVRGGGGRYTASLTYSPITTSDSGQITANVNLSDESTYMNIETMTNTVMSLVHGIFWSKINIVDIFTLLQIFQIHL